MLKLFNRRPQILVIGSAHLDAIGSYKAEESSKIDKIGEVCFSIGGTAYNIAVNLANTGEVAVNIYTHLKPNSPITQIILSKLYEEGVGLNYIRQDPNITQDSGFIAHLTDGELVSAVSASQLTKAELNLTLLDRGIRKASAVVADCNLGLDQLNAIGKLCHTHTKQLIIGGVSESKCLKAIKLSHKFDFLVVNQVEAASLTAQLNGPLTDMQGVKTIVVTKGAQGWSSYTQGTVEHFDAPILEGINNTTGAGDAFVAALALTIVCANKASLKENVDKLVISVLQKQVASGKNIQALESSKRVIKVPQV